MAAAHQQEATMEGSRISHSISNSCKNNSSATMSDDGNARRMKYVSLVTLTAQNASEAVAIRYSRIRTTELYVNSTATVVGEVFKLFASVLLLACEERSITSACRLIFRSIQENCVETSKVALISLVYVIQNNCLFVAASNLDVATYQATYQLKVLATAIFAVLMLGKRLSVTQWFSLFILVAGILLVKLSEIKTSSTQLLSKGMPRQDPLLGFVAALAAGGLSGFAGVYFEKVLKTTKESVWLRNVQMSFLSIPLALGISYANDWIPILSKGFFQGYDSFVWFALLLKACGGLLVALVVKYADNILKGFSVGMALIVGCIANVVIFGVDMNPQFLIGAGMVIASAFLYNYQPAVEYVPLSSKAGVVERVGS